MVDSGSDFRFQSSAERSGNPYRQSPRKTSMNPFSFCRQATISQVCLEFCESTAPSSGAQMRLLYRSASSSISDPTFSTSLPKPSMVLQPDNVNNVNKLTNMPTNKLFICLFLFSCCYTRNPRLHGDAKVSCLTQLVCRLKKL